MIKTSQSGIRSVSQITPWTVGQPAKPSPRRIPAFVWPFFLALLLMMNAAAGLGQALPAAEAAPISTGFSLPRAAGTLNYAVSASESLTWGYYGDQGAASGTNLTGDVGYISNSKLYPFSLVFSGGHSWANSGEPSYSFLNLGLSQVIDIKRWSFLVSDSVNYLPGTATTGLSGVAGVGDLGLTPVPVGADTGQGVLTDYSDRVANTLGGNIQRQVTGKTSFNAFGSYGIMRFVGGSNMTAGLDSDYETGGGGVSHEINPRNSFGANYSYSSYSYVGSFGAANSGFASQTASAQYSHHFTRKLSMSVAAGPQWSSVDAAGGTEAVSAFVTASMAYAAHDGNLSLSYVRSTNSGYGVVGGALSNSGSFAASRTFARVWSCSVSASYTQSSNVPTALTAPFTIDTVVAGAQASRAIVRSVSAYANYTFEHQSSNQSANTVDVFSGLEQVLGFGVTYSPSSIHFGRQ